MTIIGGNQLNCTIPFAFIGRYFIVEGEDMSRISVVVEHEGKPVFEILRNEPQDNPVSEVTKTAPGIITISDRISQKFLYKIRPDSETSIIFGTLSGENISAVINDKEIRIGKGKITRNTVAGCDVGVIVEENGRVGIGASMPEFLKQLFSPQ